MEEIKTTNKKKTIRIVSILLIIFLLMIVIVTAASFDLKPFTEKVTKISKTEICLAEENLLGDFDSDVCKEKEKEKEKEVEVLDKLNIMQNEDGIIRISFS
jgi:flagellar basal body-associated protein FliL